MIRKIFYQSLLFIVALTSSTSTKILCQVKYLLKMFWSAYLHSAVKLNFSKIEALHLFEQLHCQVYYDQWIFLLSLIVPTKCSRDLETRQNLHCRESYVWLLLGRRVEDGWSNTNILFTVSRMKDICLQLRCGSQVCFTLHILFRTLWSKDHQILQPLTSTTLSPRLMLENGKISSFSDEEDCFWCSW